MLDRSGLSWWTGQSHFARQIRVVVLDRSESSYWTGQEEELISFNTVLRIRISFDPDLVSCIF